MRWGRTCVQAMYSGVLLLHLWLLRLMHHTLKAALGLHRVVKAAFGESSSHLRLVFMRGDTARVAQF